MSLKKTVAIAAAAGALAAISVPAMAVENEFHGMYKMMAFQSNFFNGVAAGLNTDPETGFFAEQRARLQYTAKANADLKLVTNFELDTRFGGKAAAYLGTASGNDAGNLDADQLTLETKSIYLDFNCPISGANVKAGLQPFADAYQSLFVLADMTGVSASKKIGDATGTLGWFRYNDDTATAAQVGRLTQDLLVLDGKFAVSKDMTVGASYYYLTNGDRVSLATNNMVGVNADLNVGPANIKPFAAYQFGELNNNTDTTGLLLGAVTKTKIGNGAVNLSGIFLSGDTQGEDNFRTIAANQTYFNAANMWLLVRNGQQINSSTSVLGNDLTVGGLGLMGVFAGYEGTADKLFYNANIGYAQTAKGNEKGIGTELNAQVGYKLFDNMSASAAVAYLILSDDVTDSNGGAPNADDPYAVNLQLSYTF